VSVSCAKEAEGRSSAHVGWWLEVVLWAVF